MSFEAAFFSTMEKEGFYSNDHVDPGGETYMGISRVYWPSWEGWKIVDSVFSEESSKEIPALLDAVERFYRVNFWDRINGDSLVKISIPVSHEVFDTSVNMGVSTGARMFQEALNLLNNNGKIYQDLLVDGQLGGKTIETLRRYLETRPPARDVAEKRLLRVMNCLQGSHYIENMKKYPEREKFRGWFDRI